MNDRVFFKNDLTIRKMESELKPILGIAKTYKIINLKLIGIPKKMIETLHDDMIASMILAGEISTNILASFVDDLLNPNIIYSKDPISDKERKEFLKTLKKGYELAEEINSRQNIEWMKEAGTLGLEMAKVVLPAIAKKYGYKY